MDLQLAGKRAVVTGASRGIGKAIALVLGREGVDLAIAARGYEALSVAATEIAKVAGRKVVPIVFDASSKDAADALVSTWLRAHGSRSGSLFGAPRLGANHQHRRPCDLQNGPTCRNAAQRGSGGNHEEPCRRTRSEGHQCNRGAPRDYKNRENRRRIGRARKNCKHNRANRRFKRNRVTRGVFGISA